MNHFVAAPPIPSSYLKLAALNENEIAEARRYGYIADDTDPSAPVGRECSDPLLCTVEMTEHGNDIRAWRSRIYVIWFCYVFENIEAIRRPLYAVEELFLHFQSNLIVELAQMYAGAGGLEEMSSPQEIAYLKAGLRRHYTRAIDLLDQVQGAPGPLLVP